MSTERTNIDMDVVRAFGDEWKRFDQKGLSPAELHTIWESYFRIFPWDAIGPGATGFDAGCGSGRWARFVAPRAGRLICIDASADALDVAKQNLSDCETCEFHVASLDDLPFPDASCDFGYSLGVLHHVPDPPAAIRSCTAKLKPGAPFLLHLYYALDDRPAWYRLIWRMSDALRFVVSRLPHWMRHALSEIVAAIIYWPLARTARVLERFGVRVAGLPLSFYRNRSFYVMRTDALDRLGTRLERRFTRAQMEQMMRAAGLRDIRFSDQPPYWCAVGIRE